MGLLDRLKSMVSEMSEEEKKEFFDEMDAPQEKLEPEPEPEPEPLPDRIECTEEDVQQISKLREELLDMKIVFADMCLEFDRQKESMIEKMSVKQDAILEVVAIIKEKYIPDEDEREEYLLNFDPTGEELSFLFRKDHS